MTAMQSELPQPISLVIPGRPEYVGLCRLVAGVVGAREALDEESIADLKLVVTEACTCFLYGPEGPEGAEDGEPGQGGESLATSVRVEFHVGPEAWEITVSDPERKRRLGGLGSCDAMSEGGLGLTIINALVDSVEYTETEAEGSIIRLVKRFPSSAGIDI
jgi:anti-sigma regulatory factor (Ser/Thr protein kinase)